MATWVCTWVTGQFWNIPGTGGGKREALGSESKGAGTSRRAQGESAAPEAGPVGWEGLLPREEGPGVATSGRRFSAQPGCICEMGEEEDPHLSFSVLKIFIKVELIYNVVLVSGG